MTDEPKDGIEQAKLLAISAQTEQAMAGIVTFTELLGAYFKGLIQQGFLREEALDLAVEYQNALLGMPKEKE
ncbi:hypothetical protein LCGC14_1592650 [marine sediment metagenome]|uniref:Uncharacterized protein n=1 Tax=marine sediment metagenome TaxID=412755 RepID=A0A0F9LDZ6_9ZZZZ